MRRQALGHRACVPFYFCLFFNEGQVLRLGTYIDCYQGGWLRLCSKADDDRSESNCRMQGSGMRLTWSDSYSSVARVWREAGP